MNMCQYLSSSEQRNMDLSLHAPAFIPEVAEELLLRWDLWLQDTGTYYALEQMASYTQDCDRLAIMEMSSLLLYPPVFVGQCRIIGTGQEIYCCGNKLQCVLLV